MKKMMMLVAVVAVLGGIAAQSAGRGIRCTIFGGLGDRNGRIKHPLPGNNAMPSVVYECR